MKRFCRDIAFTYVFGIIMVVALEVAIYRTPNEFRYKDWYMTENADKIKTLILGNSLFSNSFDPHVLGDSVFNGAIAGRDLYYDVQVLKKYAPSMSNLKVVLVPLHVFLPVKPTCSLGIEQYQYARYMGIPLGHNPLQYSALFSGNVSFKAFASMSVFEKIEHKEDEWNPDIDSIGYCPVFRIWDGHSISVPVWKFEEGIRNRDLFIDLITEMAKDCNDLGVRLIIILPPAADVYINRVDPRLYDSIETIIPRLNKTCNFEYKFYHDDPEFCSDSLYADELHLNYWGARKFAERVKRDFGL